MNQSRKTKHLQCKIIRNRSQLTSLLVHGFMKITLFRALKAINDKCHHIVQQKKNDKSHLHAFQRSQFLFLFDLMHDLTYRYRIMCNASSLTAESISDSRTHIT